MSSAQRPNVQRLLGSGFSQLFLLGIVITAGANAQDLLLHEDFASGLGVMTATTVCGSGAGWTWVDTCLSSPGAPSAPEHARFGVPANCGDYSDGNVTVALSTPALEVSGCRQVTVQFHYLVDYQQDSSADRARVVVQRSDLSRSHLSNNGASSAGQSNCSGVAQPMRAAQLIGGSWREQRLDLTPFTADGPLRIRFEGETTSAASNSGEGFLVDDVKVFCSRFGDDFQVNATDPGYRFDADVEANSSGEFVVAWGVGRVESNPDPMGYDFGYGVQARRFAADGRPLGTELQVSAITIKGASRPAVAVEEDGGFWVVWDTAQTPAGQSRDVHARRYDSAGKQIGGELAMNQYTAGVQQSPDIWLAPDGTFVLAWSSYGSVFGDTDESSVQLRTFEADGTPVNALDLQVNSHTPNSQFGPAVDGNSAGSFVVAWTSVGSPGSDQSNSSVIARRFASGGAPISADIQVNSYTPSYQWVPDVAVYENGDFLVVWQSDAADADNDSGSVQVRRFLSSGVAAGPQTQVNVYTTGGQSLPRIGRGADGSYLVVWQSPTPDATTDIFGRWLNSGGTPLGAEFRFNSYDESNQRSPAIVSEIDPNPVVVWTGYESPGTTPWSTIARQPFLIFADGFESGDTASWTASTP